MSIYYYSAFNLVIQSPLRLPCMPIAFSETTKVDIFIHFASINAEGLSNPSKQGLTYQVAASEFYLHLPAIGRFLVSSGRHVTIEPVKGIDEDSIRAFLLTTCLEILLRQRQLTLFQGYALQRNDYAIAFAGPSGNGQALLQGLFYKRGHTFLSSNFCTLDEMGMALPGIAQLEFWPTVLASLDMDCEGLNTIRPGIKKYLFPLSQNYGVNALPLEILYIWKTHQHSEVVFSELETSGRQAYLQQLQQTNTLASFAEGENTLQLTLERLQQVEIVCIHVPLTGLKLPQLADSVERDWEKRGYCHV